MSDLSHLTGRIDNAVRAIEWLRDRVADIATVNERIIAALDAGRTVYTAGNGGSAAQALHLSEELIGRYRGNRPALRAMCLNADPTALTCIANDFGFDHVFSRQCEALLTERDVLVVLSTSGSSPNVVRALDVARGVGTTTVGLLGRDGGACLSRCDHAIVVPEEESAHIQEAHQVIVHLICEAVELHATETAARERG